MEHSRTVCPGRGRQPSPASHQE
ncbi:hypothetical protein LEMLEM_LOCUS4041 [Lemmus lemmus]